MHPRVPREISREPELLVAVLARQRLLRRVYLLVLVQVLRVGECLSAMAALLGGLKRDIKIQRSAKRLVRGCEKFLLAPA